MAQHVGTAGRPTSRTPAAFVAGTLFALAGMVTIVVLALAFGVNVQLRHEATAAHVGAVSPVRIDTRRLDPIEDAYIKRAHAAPASAPRAGFGPYDAGIDPMEQARIDAALNSSGASLGDPSWRPSTLPRHQLVPR